MSAVHCVEDVGCFARAFKVDGTNLRYVLEPGPTLPPVAAVPPPVTPVTFVAPTPPPVAVVPPPVTPVTFVAPTLPPVAVVQPQVTPVTFVAPTLPPVAVVEPAVVPAPPQTNDIVVYLTRGTLEPDQNISIQYDGVDVPFVLSEQDYMMGRASLQSAGCSACSGCSSPSPYNNRRYYQQ